MNQLAEVLRANFTNEILSQQSSFQEKAFVMNTVYAANIVRRTSYVVSLEIQYPNLELTTLEEISSCKVVLGPINKVWTLSLLHFTICHR